MNYEKLLADTKKMSKDEMKRIVFESDQHNINRIKKMDIDAEAKKKLILMSKDRSFFEMLLVNSFM